MRNFGIAFLSVVAVGIVSYAGAQVVVTGAGSSKATNAAPAVSNGGNPCLVGAANVIACSDELLPLTFSGE